MKAKFRALRYKYRADFLEFYSEFTYLAMEAKIPEEDWREELFERLPDSIAKLALPCFLDDTRTFDEFVTHCSRTTSTIDTIEKNKDARTSARSGTGGGGTPSTSRGGTGTPARTPSTGRTASKTPALDATARSKLFTEGKCFTCQETGHMSRDCPKKPTQAVSQLKILERKENDEEEPEKDAA
ncbi:hypothetical protein BDW59DRAFT_155358 [Aspergillus cavernicola]|uniref:CCHC-type domain-containing protein n=1 Tax=Aspergillus cavernicola TaxID=176166 RepID=A0ABR4H9K3_9EURO